MAEKTPPLIFETPSNKIQRVAKFYSFLGGTLEGHFYDCDGSVSQMTGIGKNV